MAVLGAADPPRGPEALAAPFARETGAGPCAVGLLPALGLLVPAGTGLAHSLGLDRWYADAVTVQGLGRALGGLAAGLLGRHLVIAGVGALGVACTSAAAVAVRRSAPKPPDAPAEG